MRHLWSLLAGVIAAPLAWLLLASGQHRSQVVTDGWDAAGRFDTVELVGPVAVLAAAGVLLGVLGTLRWSPAGPVAAGLLLVLPTVFLFANPLGVRDSMSDQWRLLGQDFAPRLPFENGTLLMLGTLLLMAAVSVQRWRSWPTGFAPIPPATDEQVISGMDELTATPPDPMSPPSEASTQPITDDDILAEARALETEGTDGAESAGGTASPR